MNKLQTNTTIVKVNLYGVCNQQFTQKQPVFNIHYIRSGTYILVAAMKFIIEAMQL